MKFIFTIFKAIASYFFGKAAANTGGVVAFILGLISLIGAILTIVDIIAIFEGTY